MPYTPPVLPPRFRAHTPQFFRYLVSGGTAAGLELGSYQLMLWAGIWYFTAAKVSGAIGLLSAFLGHKFFAFKKTQETTKQAVRFAILQGINYFAQLACIYALVEFVGVNPTIAKILAIGMTVVWNFAIYKLWVYT